MQSCLITVGPFEVPCKLHASGQTWTLYYQMTMRGDKLSMAPPRIAGDSVQRACSRSGDDKESKSQSSSPRLPASGVEFCRTLLVKLHTGVLTKANPRRHTDMCPAALTALHNGVFIDELGPCSKYPSTINDPEEIPEGRN